MRLFADRFLRIATPAAVGAGTTWATMRKPDGASQPGKADELGNPSTPVPPEQHIVGTSPLPSDFRATPPLVATDSFAVEQIVIVHRHGDRAPIGRGVGAISQGPAQLEYWRSVMPPRERLARLARRFPVESEWPEHERSAYDHSIHPLGQLTAIGADQLLDLGSRLRTHYVHRLRVLRERTDGRDILVRSTFIARVIISTQSLLDGLYPEGTCPAESVRVEVAHPDQEPQFANRCPRLSKLRDVLHSMHPQAMLDQWRDISVRAFAAVGADVDAQRDSTWALHGLREVLECSVRHGLQVPDAARAILPEASAACAEMYAHTHGPAPIARLSIGRVLAELLDEIALRVADLHGGEIRPHAGAIVAPQLPFVRRWIQVRGLLSRPPTPDSAAPGPATTTSTTLVTAQPHAQLELEPPPTPVQSHQLVIYGGHDSTVIPLLTALGVNDPSWPDYGAFVELLLLRNLASGELSIRIAYRGRVVKQVPIEEFVRAVQPLVPIDYDAECEWPPGQHQQPRDHDASVAELHAELQACMHTF